MILFAPILLLFAHIFLFLKLFAHILLESSRWTTIGSINGCFSNSSHRSIRSALKSVRESRHTRYIRIYVYTYTYTVYTHTYTEYTYTYTVYPYTYTVYTYVTYTVFTYTYTVYTYTRHQTQQDRNLLYFGSLHHSHCNAC